MRVGLDIGSTTIKCVVLDEHDSIVYSTYERHYSHILEKAQELLRRIDAEQLHGQKALLSISGSAGMGLADSCGVPFVQEVFATRVAVKRSRPRHRLHHRAGRRGRQDPVPDRRHRGAHERQLRRRHRCVHRPDGHPAEDERRRDEQSRAQQAERTYTIASRCGVFAKSDIQPLINQGARTEDIAASIYQAVVNQTIAGLAQGRPIKGNVLYLGGPLTFCQRAAQELRRDAGRRPAPARKTACCMWRWVRPSMHDEEFDLAEVAERAGRLQPPRPPTPAQPPLFANKEEYEAFHARHMQASVPRVPFGARVRPGAHRHRLRLHHRQAGGHRRERASILFTSYRPNLGNPRAARHGARCSRSTRSTPACRWLSVTTTGYGEELVKNAFHCDCGLVETVAHFTAAKHFMPDVDFIIDIGGQDMKCFKIEDGAISNIFLNEACSSGCGSFLQTFAAGAGLRREGVCRAGPVCRPPGGPGQPLHRVHELLASSRPRRTAPSIENISAGPVHQRGQERAVQGHPRIQPRGAGPQDRGAGRHLLQRGRAARL